MSRKVQTWLISWLCLGVAFYLTVLAPLHGRSLFPRAIAANPQTAPVAAEVRGVWLTNVGSAVLFVPWGVNRALQQLSQLNFNTVYPVVWNRGHTFYQSDVAKRVTGRAADPLLTSLRLGRDLLPEIVKQGHQQHLNVIPWFEYGLMAPASSQLAKRHPEWLTVRQNGTETLKEIPNEQGAIEQALPNGQTSLQKKRAIQQVWLNPLHPGVQKFVLDLIVEVVSKYDVDGIQLDDHFGMPVDFGYDRFTIELYQKEHEGQKPPDNPKDEEWMRWRADKITDLMQKVYSAVKTAKPKCLVSLSPNPQDFSYRSYLQDWQTWVERGLVEEVVLQVYRDDMKTFLLELQTPAVQEARRRIPVSVGITTGTWGTPVDIKQVQQQVKAVRDRGFQGVSFFYWESLWGYIAPESPIERRVAFKKIFAARARRPKQILSPPYEEAESMTAQGKNLLFSKHGNESA